MTSQTALNILAGELGSTIVANQAIYTGKYSRIESIGTNCIISGASSTSTQSVNVTGLNGRTLVSPFSITVPINTFQLFSGACNLVHGT
jgi:hypothetical protein